MSQDTVSCFGKPEWGQEEEEEPMVQSPQSRVLLWVLGPAVTEQDNPAALGLERELPKPGAA